MASRFRNRSRAASRALGPELFDGFLTLGDGWVDNGDGSYSCDGTQAANSAITRNILTIGITYQTIFTLANRAVGFVIPRAGETSGSQRNSDGSYTEDLLASTNGLFALRGNTAFVGDVLAISVREVL